MKLVQTWDRDHFKPMLAIYKEKIVKGKDGGGWSFEYLIVRNRMDRPNRSKDKVRMAQYISMNCRRDLIMSLS